MSADPTSQLMVLMFTDVAGSVELKARFGTQVYATLIERHDTLFREIIASLPGAETLKDMGDGFLAKFATARDAVEAALRFQHALVTERWDPAPIRVRIGLHVGQVALVGREQDGHPKLVGLATDIAARVMGLALPGQILLTRGAFDDARQYLRQHPAAQAGDPKPLRWIAHGRYLFKGNDTPLEVFEVGTEGAAPLQAPRDSAKACRSVTAEELELLGWRPARGLVIPRRVGWVLERKLGEGGFGEVWLGRCEKTGATRVFKFCFDPEKLRSLKRELTLFRLIRSLLGERRDIAQLYEVQLEQPPYFLESEYSEHGNLMEWAQKQGGVDRIPLQTRFDLVACTARAVAAAHSVGILHKDIKPANILIYYDDNDRPRPRLADFGIGELVDRSRLDSGNITSAGFTKSIEQPHASGTTGTQMYLPPESLVGQPFTMQGDVYSLGVLLFQLVAGNLELPLASGWQRHIEADLIGDDVAACVDGDLARRLPTADALADRLDQIETRRAERQAAAMAAKREQRRRKLAHFGLVASLALAALLTVASAFLVKERSLRARATQAEQLARRETDRAQATYEFLERMFTSIDPAVARGQEYSVRTLLDGAATRIRNTFADQPAARSALHETLGKTYQRLGYFKAAREQLQAALETRRQQVPPAPDELVSSLMALGGLYHETGTYDLAEPLYDEAIATCEGSSALPPTTLVRTLGTLAVLLIDMQDFDQAGQVAQRALDLARETYGAEHMVVSSSLTTCATVQQCRGDYVAAERMLVEVLEMRRRLCGPDGTPVISSLNNLACLLLTKGDIDRAGERFREGLTIAQQTLPPGHWLIPFMQAGQAACFTAQGQVQQAEPLLLESYRRLAIAVGRTNARTRQVITHLIELYEEWDKPEAAAQWRARLSTSQPAAEDPSHAQVDVAPPAAPAKRVMAPKPLAR